MAFWDDFFECGSFFLKLQQISSYEYEVNFSEAQTPSTVYGWQSSFTGWSNIQSFTCEQTIPVEGNSLKSLSRQIEYIHESSPYCGCDNVVKGDIYDWVETVVYEGGEIDHYNYVFKRDWYYYAAYSLESVGSAHMLGLPVVVALLVIELMLRFCGEPNALQKVFVE